jgi:hypothetical protein
MKSMVDFARTSAGGGFEINEEGGDRLLKAIDGFQNWIDDRSEMIGWLGRSGSSVPATTPRR